MNIEKELLQKLRAKCRSVQYKPGEFGEAVLWADIVKIIKKGK